jgi:hypothetical protein
MGIDALMKQKTTIWKKSLANWQKKLRDETLPMRRLPPLLQSSVLNISQSGSRIKSQQKALHSKNN